MSFDIFESELCSIVELEPDGTIVRVGKGWNTVLKWPAEEVQGQRIQLLCGEQFATRFDAALANIARGAPSAVVRARFPRGSHELLLSCRIEPVGEQIFLTAEDVGERHAVLPLESKLQSVVDFATDAWLVHDLEGRIVDANPWACKSLGYSRKELLQLVVADFEMTIKPGRMDGIWNRMTVGQPETVEGLQRRKDGSTFPVEIRLGLFATEDDEVLMLAICRDITERKKQAEALASANAELQKFNEHLEAEVAARTAELQKVERHRRELEIARRIQMSVLPQLPSQFGSYAADGHMVAADEVGGDYLDVIPTDDGGCWIAVGDVSGHGLMTGLTMLMCQSALQVAVQSTDRCPATVLTMVNELLVENRERTGGRDHMTLTVCRFDPDGAVTFAGGHEVILVRRASGEVDEVDTPGPWIGALSPLPTIPTWTLQLGEGDQLWMYTDGVTEAAAADGEMFGLNRLKAMIADGTTPERVIEAALSYAQRCDDDATVLTISRERPDA